MTKEHSAKQVYALPVFDSDNYSQEEDKLSDFNLENVLASVKQKNVSPQMSSALLSSPNVTINMFSR